MVPTDTKAITFLNPAPGQDFQRERLAAIPKGVQIRVQQGGVIFSFSVGARSFFIFHFPRWAGPVQDVDRANFLDGPVIEPDFAAFPAPRISEGQQSVLE